ncbi:hypothetical protein MMPV_006127 [Pyropia vietnamensis]
MTVEGGLAVEGGGGGGGGRSGGGGGRNGQRAPHDAAAELSVLSVVRGTPHGRPVPLPRGAGAAPVAAFLPAAPDELLLGPAGGGAAGGGGGAGDVRLLAVGSSSVVRGFTGHRAAVTGLAVVGPPGGAAALPDWRWGVGGGGGPGGGAGGRPGAGRRGGGGPGAGPAAFASTSLDGSVRLWDKATPRERAVLRGAVRGWAAVAYDPAGVVLGVAFPGGPTGGGGRRGGSCRHHGAAL